MIDVLDQAMQIPGLTKRDELEFLYNVALQASFGGSFVELGTYLGRTLFLLAQAAIRTGNDLLSVDTYSYDQNCSLEAVRQNLLKFGLGEDLFSERIRLLEADSGDWVPGYGDIHLLFVDSDHHKAHFDREMDAWLGHVGIGGFIVCHDYESPTWSEMAGAIDFWLRRDHFRYVGSARRMVAFQSLRRV